MQRKTLSDAHKDSAFWLSLGFGSLCTGAAILCGHVVATIYGKPALDTVMPVLASRILFRRPRHRAELAHRPAP